MPEALCPYCQQAIHPNTAVIVCERCQTWYHPACWEAHAGCAVATCQHPPTTTPSNRRLVGTPRWKYALLGLVLVIFGSLAVMLVVTRDPSHRSPANGVSSPPSASREGLWIVSQYTGSGAPFARNLAGYPVRFTADGRLQIGRDTLVYEVSEQQVFKLYEAGRVVLFRFTHQDDVMTLTGINTEESLTLVRHRECTVSAATVEGVWAHAGGPLDAQQLTAPVSPQYTYGDDLGYYFGGFNTTTPLVLDGDGTFVMEGAPLHFDLVQAAFPTATNSLCRWAGQYRLADGRL
ncbi:MAG TPA: RING finger protein, partial [Armatimonadota bacterium]|nr:RING finger protein [Armatimonadota bacterium]